MEGVVLYRLLGSHPAASGRHLTLSFPGEATTIDKIIEQVVQEHRVNMSRYKLEVCKLVPAGSATASGAPSSPPPSGSSGGDLTSSGSSQDGGSARDGLVPVPMHGGAEVRTYDRLNITVSQRQLADEEATSRGQEQAERQRRIEEMEEQLLSSTAGDNLLELGLGGSLSGGGDAGRHSSNVSPLPVAQRERGGAAGGRRGEGVGGGSSSAGARGGVPSGLAATPAVDSLRLQRAAALASQLFPTRKGQSSTLSGLDDPANTHHCVLCRLAAFEETLTPCCRFPVCASCYASAAEMDMEEGRCPVCGSRTAQRTSAAAGVGGEGGGHAKRERDDDEASTGRAVWKREEGEEAKAALQRTLGIAERSSQGREQQHPAEHRDANGASGRAQAAVNARRSEDASSHGVSKELQQVEDRLRQGLDKALASLDGPDLISAAAKAKRVMSAELAALCEM